MVASACTATIALMPSPTVNLSPADIVHEPFQLRHTNGKCDLHQAREKHD